MSGFLNTNKKWNGLRITGLVISLLELLFSIIFLVFLFKKQESTNENSWQIEFSFIPVVAILRLINSVLIFVSKNNSKVLFAVLTFFFGSIVAVFFWLFSKPEIYINTIQGISQNQVNSINHNHLDSDNDSEWL